MSQLTTALPDGRRIAWSEYGRPDDRPVLYCHGFPASGAEAAFTRTAARSAHARIVAPDRPGFGGSTPVPGRALTDWVDDAVALLDALGIATAPIVGMSGGGPYALACAALRPDRFPRVATFGALGSLERPGSEAGMAPFNRLCIRLARDWPLLQAGVFHAVAALIRRQPLRIFRMLSADASAADRALFRDPDVRAMWAHALYEGVQQGAGGAIEELRLYARRWGFEPGAVGTPVELWHGRADPVVPLRHAEHYAAMLPQATPRFIAGEGHFSLPTDRIGEALERLLAEAPAARTSAPGCGAAMPDSAG